MLLHTASMDLPYVPIDDTDTRGLLRKTGKDDASALCALLALNPGQTCQSGSIADDVQVRDVLATLGVNIATDGLSSASGDGNAMEPIGLEPTTSCMPCMPCMPCRRAGGKKPGLRIVDALESEGVHVRHTFGGSSIQNRKRKLAFHKGDARIKATTLHSFKGWEARHLVVFVADHNRQSDRAALYTAMTRLQRHEHGSMLTVVSACPALAEFGKTWPTATEA